MQWNRLFFVGAILIAASALALTPAQDNGKPDEKGTEKFHRGAKPTPFPKIVEAIKSGRAKIYRAEAPPSQVVVVPVRLSVWGNDRYGCCVTSESVFAISDYSTYVKLPQIFVTEAETIRWAKAHGWLNGAWLLDVIEDMQKDGIKDENGVLRKAGTAATVDYRNEDTLKSAIAQGPVSIAIGADALPGGAGSKNGWYVFGGRSFPNTDHCVSLHGYGPTSELFKALNTNPPANAPANGYLLFTWGTIGVVDHKWLLNTCAEAWVRNPTTTELQPPPPPQPTEVTVTASNVTGVVGSPVKFLPSAKGGTSPYIFLFEYGDGSQDAAGSHTYKESGSYKVTVTAVDSTGKIGTTTCTATISATPLPPGPSPSGLMFHLPQDTPAGMYNLVRPSDLDEIQRRLDAIRGIKR